MVYDPLKAAHPGRGLVHDESYWTATAGPEPADDGPLDGDRETDIAIIGGGYTGLSCAYHLARTFGARPVVLEANRAGWGCSGRNGSFARPALGRLKYTGEMLSTDAIPYDDCVVFQLLFRALGRR